MPLTRRKRILLIVLAALVAGDVTVLLRRLHEDDRHRFVAVRPGVLYRACQPHGADWAQLRPLGITRVVNLRPRLEDPQAHDEDVRQCAAAGVRLVGIPMHTTHPTDEQMEQYLGLFFDGGGAVLVHCEHGWARTGLMAAAYRVIVEGRTADEAWAELLSYWRGVPESPERMAARRAVLDALESRRGAWLERLSNRAASRAYSRPDGGAP